jgi:hypothetical protein
MQRWTPIALAVPILCGCARPRGDASDPWMTAASAWAGSESDADSGADPQPGDDDDAATGEATSVGSSEDGGSSGPVIESTGGGDPSGLDPPAGESSGGSGGGPGSGDVRSTASGVQYRVVADGDDGVRSLMIVYSGTEGGSQMAANLVNLGPVTGTASFVFAVLDGVDYYGDGSAGADVLDHVRTQYDVDNDRTYLLSESAGTSAGLQLGLQLRQSYFAAFWANDVNASAGPLHDAAALGFAPFGNAGPGGNFAEAEAIVSAMAAAGYRTPEPSPYDGPGASDHGASDQFVAALQWFPGKARQ